MYRTDRIIQYLLIRKEVRAEPMEEIVQPLLDWYAVNRRELPWRQEEKNPYQTWISEIMLQQTRVEAVKGYYERFIGKLPELKDLAEVPEEELMKLWQGLGYYNRARNLKRAARMLEEEYGGSFPESYGELLKLPGIGEYTAGAIASIVFGERVPAVDGNVYRIYTRLQEDGRDITRGRVRKEIRESIADMVPEGQAGEFNQALMDLGAMVCLPNGVPDCQGCPLMAWCRAGKKGTAQEYPVKAKKKPRRIEEYTIFVLEYQDRYLIKRRPEEGLLAGLWGFPAREGRVSLKELRAMLAERDISQGEVELLGKAKHIFSHVEWHMAGYLIHLKEIPEEWRERLVSATRQELRTTYSIPSAYSFYLKQIVGK